MLDLYTLSSRGQKDYATVFGRRTPLPSLHLAVLLKRSRAWGVSELDCPQARFRRLRVFVPPMRSLGGVRVAKHVSKKLGVDSSQTWLHFGDGDKVLLDVIKGVIIKWNAMLRKGGCITFRMFLAQGAINLAENTTLNHSVPVARGKHQRLDKSQDTFNKKTEL